MTTANILFKAKDMFLTHPILILAGTVAALIVSAKIQVPMIPVPITFQTAVVLIIPCLFGWRMALGALSSYFALGMVGLPVFSMAAGAIPGPAYFMGPTGGYLIGFVAAAAMVGWLYQKKESWSLNMLLGLILAGHAVILALGFVWLAYGVPSLGMQQAFTAGVVPFVTGGILKTFIATFFVLGVTSK